MTAKKPKSQHKPNGRPKTVPEGARSRTIRCTDAEYEALKQHLAALRSAVSGKSAK